MSRLQTQLSFSIMLVILFTVAVISFLSNLLISQEFETYIVEQQKTKTEDFVLDFSNQYNGLTQEWNTEYIHGAGMYALFDGYIIKVYDRTGGVVWDAENHNMAICEQIMYDIIERMEEKRPNAGGEFASHDYDLTMNGQKIGSITISYYGPYFFSESDFHFLDTLNLALAIVGTISLLLSLIISTVLARRIARPITKMAYIAKQISGGNYSIRFAGKTKSRELDELAVSINCLAGGLAEQENLRKRLTADVAHELRTPLTALSAHLEAMIEGVWEPGTERLRSCYEESVRLSGLVSDIERLAKTESGNLVLNKADVDLMDIVHSACDNFEMDMNKKNLSLEIDGGSSIIHADRDRLSQLMANLLSNAIKYTLANGSIRIEVTDSKKFGTLIIEDDGIGISENELPLIFERFYRTDKSRNRKTGGAGIGLAIVKSIAEAHGGTVKAESRTEHGSRFIITLPK